MRKRKVCRKECDFPRRSLLTLFRDVCPVCIVWGLSRKTVNPESPLYFSRFFKSEKRYKRLKRERYKFILRFFLVNILVSFICHMEIFILEVTSLRLFVVTTDSRMIGNYVPYWISTLMKHPLTFSQYTLRVPFVSHFLISFNIYLLNDVI